MKSEKYFKYRSLLIDKTDFFKPHEKE